MKNSIFRKINADDLEFTYEIEDDRTNTYLLLNDYDWMEYKLRTKFKTEEQGTLIVSMVYFGMTISDMFIKKVEEGKYYRIEFDTKIYQKYITRFLTKHIEMWNSQYAFNGEEIVIDFFNEVIENMNKIVEIDPREFEAFS